MYFLNFGHLDLDPDPDFFLLEMLGPDSMNPQHWYAEHWLPDLPWCNLFFDVLHKYVWIICIIINFVY